MIEAKYNNKLEYIKFQKFDNNGNDHMPNYIELMQVPTESKHDIIDNNDIEGDVDLDLLVRFQDILRKGDNDDMEHNDYINNKQQVYGEVLQNMGIDLDIE